MASLPLDDSLKVLSSQPVDRAQRRLALGVVVASVAVFALVAPFARQPMAQVPAFYPLYQSAVVVCDLITALLLFGQFGVARSRALLVLASGYLFGAAMAVAHALSFPGLFSPGGLLGSNAQSTAWIYFFWHLGFPAAVVGYGVTRGDARTKGVAVAIASALALAAAILLTALATAGHDALPALMQADADRPAKYAVAWVTWLLTLAALPVLWRRPRLSVLDLWLIAVICAWLCDVALAAVFNAGRYSLGWYAGRVYGLGASAFVLVVLLLENASLYVRLARAHAQEHRLNESLEARIRERTAALERSRAELRELAAVGSTAREQEKTRIARELHDELGQSLTALKMDLRSLQQTASAPDAAARLAGMQQIVDEMQASARRIAADLRPLTLDDLGLVAAAQWLVENFGKHHGVACELEIDPPEFELADPQATAVFRILQESLTNVARHSGASRARIALTHGERHVRLRVSDDGKGFDPSAARRPNAFGVLGLRERAHLVSGEITIDSAPGRGTTIEVVIPLGGAG